MTSLKAVKPRTSAAVVAVVTDVYVNTRCVASPMRYAKHRVNTNTCPVAITTVSARCRHRFPSPAVQVPASNLGSVRMSESEPHPQLRRVNSDRSRHRCPSPVVQVPARDLGSSRVNGPESYHQLRRVSSASWHAHLSSARKPPSVHRRSATTRTRLHGLRSPESCETQLMTNVSPSRHRPGPNPTLKRSTNGRPPGPVWRYAVHFRQPGPGVLPLPPA